MGKAGILWLLLSKTRGKPFFIKMVKILVLIITGLIALKSESMKLPLSFSSIWEARFLFLVPFK